MHRLACKHAPEIPLDPKDGDEEQNAGDTDSEAGRIDYKDKVVLPIPFTMLIKVLLVYKNGHIQDRVTMYPPAMGLWNSTVPIQLPNVSSSTQQMPPGKCRSK